MSWQEYCRNRLPAELDEQGDLAPPWERFPDYERHCLGWRMGGGETWLGLWHVFLDGLDSSHEVRLAYLQRHAPAPICWADSVYRVLHPSVEEDEDDQDGDLGDAQRAELAGLGLIASDIAYPTWLKRQEGVRWPWLDHDSPAEAARHDTRVLWYWSRQVAELRRVPSWVPPRLPPAWQPCAAALRTGSWEPGDLSHGLQSLACLLAAGAVLPPWELGLAPDSFADSFELDMGYTDAFRLWGMSVFDDREQLERYLEAHPLPDSWSAWVEEQILVP